MGYMGGKSQSGVWQRILNLIPPHEVYIEPFLGSGAIMRKKRPAAVSIGLDLAAPKMAGLERFDIRQGCGIAFLESYPFTGREFVYADPPYLHSTRGRARYEYELNDADHVRLLDLLRRLPCAVMISGYPSPLYAEKLRGWQCDEFDVMTRGHTWARECLWFNYPRPEILHDLGNVGVNFRDRLRIRRKRARWQARLRRMPALERATLFAALLEAMGSDCGHYRALFEAAARGESVDQR